MFTYRGCFRRIGRYGTGNIITVISSTYGCLRESFVCMVGLSISVKKDESTLLAQYMVKPERHVTGWFGALLKQSKGDLFSRKWI